MTFADDNPTYPISSDDQARRWMEDLMRDCEEARRACDALMFGSPHVAATQVHLKRTYDVLLMKHGGALGSLTALHRCGKLSDTAHNEMGNRIRSTLVPSKGVLH